MTEPSVFARSVNGEVLRWRPHAFAALTDRIALQYEPWLLTGTEAVTGPLIVETTPDAFRWDAVSAPSVVVKGIRERTEALAVVFDRSGESGWRDWPGCTYVDLFPVNGGRLAGEVVRLLRVTDVSGRDVEFTVGTRTSDIVIRPMSKGLAAAHVILWRRVQHGNWRSESLGVLGAGGRAFAIPQYQGAFAVEGQHHQLLGLQFFGFGRLVEAHEEDRLELAHEYPLSSGASEWDDWPLWIQEQFMEPLGGLTSDAADTSPRLDVRLRTRARRALLRPHLTSPVLDWRPDLTLEDFVSALWPQLGSVLELGLDSDALVEAFTQRESPSLAEAIEWARGDAAVFTRALAVAGIRREHRRLSAVLPLRGESRVAADALKDALDHVARGGSDVTRRAEVAWGRLKDAVRFEFDVHLEALDETAVAEFAWKRALTDGARQLQVPVDSRSQGECLQAIAERFEAAVTRALPALLDRCVEAGLLRREDFEAAFDERRRRAGDLIDNVLRSIPPRYRANPPAEVDRITALQRHRNTIAATVACDQMSRELRELVRATLDRKHPHAGIRWRQDAHASLEASLEAALAEVREIESRSEEDARRQRQLSEIRHWLPGPVDPESPAAAGAIRGHVRALHERVRALREACPPEFLRPADHGSLVGIESEVQSRIALPDSADVLQILATVQMLDRCTVVVAGIERRALAELRQQRGVGEHVTAWFDRGGFELAMKAADVERTGQELFWSTKPPLAELLWLSDDEYVARALVRLAAEVRTLGDVRTADDVRRLEGALAQALDRIARAHQGASQLGARLRAERDRRWTEFAGALPGGRVMPSSALPGILRAAGAATYGPHGPSIDAHAATSDLAPGELRTRLRTARLWPAEEFVPS